MKPLQIITLIFFLAVNLLVIGTNTVSAQTPAIKQQYISTEVKSENKPVAPNLVRGTIADQTGDPIPGANVKVEGSSRVGVQTDFDGNFTIQASTGETLVFTYEGSITEKRVINSQTEFFEVRLKDEIHREPAIEQFRFTRHPVYAQPCALPKTEEKKLTFFGRVFHSIGNLFR